MRIKIMELNRMNKQFLSDFNFPPYRYRPSFLRYAVADAKACRRNFEKFHWRRGGSKCRY